MRRVCAGNSTDFAAASPLALLDFVLTVCDNTAGEACFPWPAPSSGEKHDRPGNCTGSGCRAAAARLARTIPRAAPRRTQRRAGNPLPHLLSAAEQPAQLSSVRARTRFIFHIATLPGLIALALIIPFRVPRELTEVVGPPVVVALVGIVWIQAGAWRFDRVTPQGEAGAGAIAYPLSAVLVLLLLFQLLLRPGIPFY